MSRNVNRISVPAPKINLFTREKRGRIDEAKHCHWGAGNVYSPPNRAWYFDINLISSPPPGLLASYNYLRSRWYMQ